MTTLMVVDGDRGETRSQAVARRLKGALAEANISVAEVARRLNVTQQKLSRRMTGQTPFDVNELDEICTAAGISFEYVATGIRAIPTGDGGDDGGAASAPSRTRTYDLRIISPSELPSASVERDQDDNDLAAA